MVYSISALKLLVASYSCDEGHPNPPNIFAWVFTCSRPSSGNAHQDPSHSFANAFSVKWRVTFCILHQPCILQACIFHLVDEVNQWSSRHCFSSMLIGLNSMPVSQLTCKLQWLWFRFRQHYRKANTKIKSTQNSVWKWFLIRGRRWALRPGENFPV